MKPVTPAEILSIADYERSRAERRQHVLDVKALRRVHVGDHITILFENHDTVLYQIQEMLRVEHITQPAAIRHEIGTYNELIAAPDELRATLLIEYADPAERDRRLRELIGLDSHVWLEVAGAGSCRADFDERQLSERRISSVHYVTFALGASLAGALRAAAATAVAVTIGVDHPALTARADLSREQIAALAFDLAAE